MKKTEAVLESCKKTTSVLKPPDTFVSERICLFCFEIHQFGNLIDIPAQILQFKFN